MDVGFLGLAYKMNMDYALLRQEVTILKEIPYESELKYAAAVYAEKEQAIACMKGAVENVLSFCDHAISDGKKVRLDSEAIEKMADQMAEQGLRVLAVASGELDSKHSFTGELMDYKTLGFLGLVGFIDPLRKEAADAVEKCFDAGIKVLMITGDHPATAEAIAREIGLLEDGMKVVTGTMLKQAGDFKENSFEELALSTNVFARVSPTQKFEIVDVLIRNGEFVAVTGDGVNDTPALRRANIGVAMGSGTDVAKEVGDMIIADDNFSSIVAGVEEGRFAYDNVRKVISLLIATGTGTVVLSIIAVMMGMPLPLLPVQLLWLNLVTNGIQDVALAFEAGEKDAMERKPRRTNESVFNNTMIGQTMVSGFWMGLLTLGFWYYLNKVIHLGSEDLPYARNLLLLLFVLLQNVHVFNCRSERKSAFKVPISNNYLLIGGVVFALAIHVTCMHLPFMQGILHVQTIKTSDFVLTAGLALSLLVVYELYKWFSYGERKVKRLKKLKNSLQPGI
jgi:magnesium-transporting ATPase (P-type)